eukprot:2002891-Rhodomonas_salina.1
MHSRRESPNDSSPPSSNTLQSCERASERERERGERESQQARECPPAGTRSPSVGPGMQAQPGSLTASSRSRRLGWKQACCRG